MSFARAAAIDNAREVLSENASDTGQFRVVWYALSPEVRDELEFLGLGNRRAAYQYGVAA